MRIMDVINFIRVETDDPTYRLFPNKFPRDGAGVTDECGAVTIMPGGGIDEWTGKKTPSIQVLLRGTSTGTAALETKAHEIFDALKNKRDVTIGSESVAIIRPVGAEPFYIGDDENARPIYSMNFNVVVRPSFPPN